jgi:hypothetical protein
MFEDWSGMPSAIAAPEIPKPGATTSAIGSGVEVILSHP